jgi:chromosome segregation ATPase
MKQQTKTRSIDERIASAFSATLPSVEVTQLIREVEAEAKIAAENASSARARALDPALTLEHVTAARRDMEDSSFRYDRMRTALLKLQERLNSLRAHEEDARRRAIYEKAKANRDALAAELQEVYPSLAERLADLADRVAASDREIEQVNTRSRPMSAETLISAELTARGIAGFVNSGGDVPRIATALRLPAFKFNPHQPFTWPR